MKIGQESLLPSLQLAVEDPNSSSSNCGEGYSCSYTNSISWIELPTPDNEPTPRTSPLPMELNPQVVFERLFGSGATPEVRAARLRENRSILDSVLSELGGLKKVLAQAIAAPSINTPTRSARSSGASACRQGFERRARDGLAAGNRNSSTTTSRCTSTSRRWPSARILRAWRRSSARAI
jgi:hypothetical protein